MNRKIKIICRGGGDLATGIVYRLSKAGFQVLILEQKEPTAIRRQVSFCEAIYDGEATVEDMTAEHIRDWQEAEQVWEKGNVPILIDEIGAAIAEMKPDIVVDAMIAKRNLGTTKEMAPLVIGVGPGFCAGEDVHVVVETMRGHNLGRVLTSGSAYPDTHIPGNIGGYTKERVIHAPATGRVHHCCEIGDLVSQGQVIAFIDTSEATGERAGKVPVKATIDGIVRGLIREGFGVQKGFKMADIDPRKEELQNCFTISDKARCIAGGVLEAVCGFVNER